MTEFKVNTEYISCYTAQKVEGVKHLEHWIRAKKLESFHQNIRGEIKLIASFRGKP